MIVLFHRRLRISVRLSSQPIQTDLEPASGFDALSDCACSPEAVDSGTIADRHPSGSSEGPRPAESDPADLDTGGC